MDRGGGDSVGMDLKEIERGFGLDLCDYAYGPVAG